MKGTTKSRGDKEALDKFYTNPEIAKQCIALVDNKEAFDLIIEPSAGAGSFSNSLACMAYDIAPEGDGILQADWLTLDKTPFENKKVLVIGNPPFGRQGTLALDFFNISATFCDTIAFILPLSFKKRSIQAKLNPFFWLDKEWILPKNSFLLHGETYDVPCVFQIWSRQKKARPKQQQITTSPFIAFVKDPTMADFRIQRVGGNAGKAFLNLNVSAQSNYFIKNTSTLSTPELMKLINNLVFPEIEYTVGPKSLSKTELIVTLEEALKTINEDV
jgi:hypothetical protein